MLRSLLLAALAAIAVLSTGCASTQDPSSGPVVHAPVSRTQAAAVEGTVIAVQPIVVQGPSANVGRTLGAATGAAIGAFLAPVVNNRAGVILAPAISTAAGAIGFAVGERLSRQQSAEVIVRIGATTSTVVVPADDARGLAPGQVVHVVQGAGGARIYAR